MKKNYTLQIEDYTLLRSPPWLCYLIRTLMNHTTEPAPYKVSQSAWPTNMFDEVATLRHVARQLAHLAGAFDRTGNTQVAAELFEVHDYMKGATEAISNHVAGAVRRGLRDAEQSTSNMLGAVLAMTKIAKAAPKGD